MALCPPTELNRAVASYLPGAGDDYAGAVYELDNSFVDEKLLTHDFIEHGLFHGIAGFHLWGQTGLYELGSTLIRVWAGYNDRYRNSLRLHFFSAEEFQWIRALPVPENYPVRLHRAIQAVGDKRSLKAIIAGARAFNHGYRARPDDSLTGLKLAGLIVTLVEKIVATYPGRGRAVKAALGREQGKIRRFLFGGCNPQKPRPAGALVGGGDWYYITVRFDPDTLTFNLASEPEAHTPADEADW